MTVFGLMGLLGVGFYLSSYALLQFGVIRGTSFTYILMNLAASVLVMVSLYEDFNLASFLIQLSWIVISICGITRQTMLRRASHLSPEDERFHATALPGMRRSEIVKLLDLGSWDYLNDGTTLTVQGEAVEDLIFIRSGSVRIEKNGETIAEVGPDHFIGEMTCLHGTPATATAITQGSVRCLRIPAKDLRHLIRRNHEIQGQLERSFTADLQRKLGASADRLRSLSRSTAA